MDSCVLGTIELADHPIEVLAPTALNSRPNRLWRKYEPHALCAENLYVGEEVLDADLATLRLELERELVQLKQAANLLGTSAF